MIPNNIYEVNIRQYTPEGTFNAFAKYLPRLQKMGIEMIWLMPITPISEKKRQGTLGSYYACSDYTAINPEFGNLDDFKNLVSQAHQLGIRVILDWVANHTGWDHRWTLEHPDYFYINEKTGEFKTPDGMADIIELNFTDPALRKAMIDAMQFWITECNIDGYRCDMAFWVELDFWIEAKNYLHKTKKLFWLGEYDALDFPEYNQVFDSSYTWSWMHRTQEYYQQKISLADMLAVMKNYERFIAQNHYPLWFTTNHDENSWNGTEFEKYGDMVKVLSVFSACFYGIHLLYSGQELPNKNRLQFFEKDCIQWKDNLEYEKFYQNLISIHRWLYEGKDEKLAPKIKYIPTSNNDYILAFKHTVGEKKLIVFLNFSNKNLCSINFDASILQEEFVNLHKVEEKLSKKSNTVPLSAWAYKIFSNNTIL